MFADVNVTRSALFLSSAVGETIQLKVADFDHMMSVIDASYTVNRL
ncbi:hypothetical protein [Chelatococcus reniformis]|nr:hypothetical protein [Chelatococcus reniformis]